MADAAAKETTMEDILASIRKIISQDDSRAAPQSSASRAAPVRPAPQPAPARPAEPSRYTPRPAPHSNDARAAAAPEPRRAAPAAQKPNFPPRAPAPAPRPPSANTLAELADRVKAEMPRVREAAREPAAREPAYREPAPREQVPREQAMREQLIREQAAREAAVRESPMRPPTRPTRVELPREAPTPPPPPFWEEQYEPARAFDGVSQSGRIAESREREPEPMAPEPFFPSEPPARGGMAEEEQAFREALVSPSTESAIGESLQRLKQVVGEDLGARVDSILRPMLREWLDDNLPDLVERLVRDEIERLVRR